MAFDPGIKIGEIVTNERMRAAFAVGNMGGMRKSNTHNCLVLISDHTKGFYEDKWHGDEIHYTGMGKTGDQVLNGNQNLTLYNSRTNGVEIHLFEVLEETQYIYRGIVNLSGDPYQDDQVDVDGNKRKVWMFPLKPLKGAPVMSSDVIKKVQEKKQHQAESMNISDLRKAAKANSAKKPGTRKVISNETIRDPYISEYTKRLANGICSLCGNAAPFCDSKGNPYLETHHIVWLSRGGEDSIDNTAALCPNCHRKMHIVNDPKDIMHLQSKAKYNSTLF